MDWKGQPKRKAGAYFFLLVWNSQLDFQSFFLFGTDFQN